MNLERGVDVTYTQDKLNRLRSAGPRNGREGSVVTHRDVNLYAIVLEPGARVTHALAGGRKGWIQIARGAVELNRQPLQAGDGVALQGNTELALTGADSAEWPLFDMA